MGALYPCGLRIASDGSMITGNRQCHGEVSRFWAAPTDRVRLDRFGYLVDPSATAYGVSANPAPRGTDQVRRHACAALLAEPGGGKTTALDDIRKRLQADPSYHGLVRTVDLAEYGDEGRLLDDLFRGPQGDGERASSGEIALLLDGLDECKLQIPRVGKLLAGALRKHGTECLRLFVACRSADWPVVLGEALAELYDDFAPYNLLPLRRTDVAALARQDGKDETAFLAAVERLDVVPLATKPLTLRLLLRAFDPAQQSLPGGQVGVYRRGLLTLADEWNRERREAGLAGKLTLEQRLAIAQRLAATIVFSGSSTLWSGPTADALPSDLPIDTCVGGMEPTGTGSVEVTREAVEETIATALFAGQAPSRFSWAHQTYMEYLAASCLVSRRTQPGQLRNLLVSGNTAIPQLRAVTMWLAAMGGIALDAVIAADPQSFIGHGIDLVDDTAKATLVDSLLDHARRGELRRQPGIDLRNLDHPTLAAQLRPVLEDQTGDDEVRHWAIAISEAVGASELQDTWLSIALDPDASEGLRIDAGDALVRLGDPHSKAVLRPLAEGSVGPDPYDELKGVGLKATWPGTFTITEVLERLTPPKRRNLTGAYKTFLINDLPESLTLAHAEKVLLWAISLPDQRVSGRGLDRPFHRLVDRALRIAAQHAEQGELADAFARIALWRARQHEPMAGRDPHGQPLELSEPARQAVREAVLPLLEDHRDVLALLDLTPPLVTSDDFPYVVQCCREADDATLSEALGYLAANLFLVEEPSHRELVLALDRDTDLYRDYFARWCEPVRLDSELAVSQRGQRSQPKQTAEQPGQREDIETLRSQLADLLDGAAQGDMDQWWRFDALLHRDPNGSHDVDASEFADDLTSLAGWSLLTPEQKTAAFDIAERYLSKGSAHTSQWLGTATLYRPAMAGYRAAVLLLRHAPERFNRLPATAWAEWAAIAVNYPITDHEPGSATRDDLVRVAYRHAPDAVLSALNVLIEKDNEEGHLFRRAVLEAIWDDRLAEQLMALLHRSDLTTGLYTQLLGLLLQHCWDEAQTHAHGILRGTDEHFGRELRVAVARTMLQTQPSQCWAAVWELTVREPSFGTDVFLSMANGDGLPVAALSSDEIAELYIWLTEQFPPEEDPEFDYAHPVGPREALGHSRDRLLSELIQRASHQALDATERIAARFPERVGLRNVMLQARESYRRNSWQPIQPATLLTLLGDPEKRLVRDGDELLEVLSESMDRLQEVLQGETPEAPLLWEIGRPKPEPQLTDYLKNRLEQQLTGRGIVANREVEVRRSPGAGIGERTDVHVDAATGFPSGNVDSLTAIIEVKGSWHDDLLTALRGQLFAQYMLPAGVRQGIYVVFWFGVDEWDDSDGRRAKATRKDRREVQERLEGEAAALMTEGVSIRVVFLDC